MRKVVFKPSAEIIKKLMIYVSSGEIYLFGYDSVDDRPSLFDRTFDTIESAEESCKSQYGVNKDDWIVISDPLPGCQDDFIMPTRVKGRESGNPIWGRFQFLNNNKWFDLPADNRHLNFDGLTGNERLYVSGLFDEFEEAKIHDKPKAIKILATLGFDTDSISKIVA